MQTEESPLPRILEEIAQLNTRLHELSIQNYRQVVDARQSLSRCGAASIELESKVETATNQALPALIEKLSGFQDIGRRIVQQHKRTLATIDLHTQLVDLLQIPQLMDTCARSGAIEEALELCSFARTLRTRHDAIAESIGSTTTGSRSGTKGESSAAVHGNGVEIVRWVADEVEQSALAMRRQLLQQLRGQVDLPTCLRLLSYLKRLDAQQRKTNSKRDESTLRREFLEARDAYLQMQTLGASERGDPAYQATLKAVQKNREIWFDVITQYQAIFGMNAEDDSAETLSRWIGFKVKEFLQRLSESLSRFENCGELGTVYELSSSFAASLSRVGADFRPLLPSLFLKRTKELMLAHWGPACAVTKDAFASGNWGEALPVGPASSPTTAGGGDLAPPMQLLQFPAVVDLVNTMIRSFNDLRNFACVNLVRELATELKSELERCVEGLEAFDRKNAEPSERKRFDVLGEMFANVVLPYIARCFAAVFDWKTSSANQLLDVTNLTERVRKLVPGAQPLPHAQPRPIVAQTPAKATAAATPIELEAQENLEEAAAAEEPTSVSNNLTLDTLVKEEVEQPAPELED